MQLIFKVFLLTVIASVAVFSDTNFTTQTTKKWTIATDEPHRVNLSNYETRATFTNKIRQKIMPLVNAAAGQNYTLLYVEDAWDLVKNEIKSNVFIELICFLFST